MMGLLQEGGKSNTILETIEHKECSGLFASSNDILIQKYRNDFH